MASRAATYFDLMEIVGTKGPYQTYLFIIMFMLWLITSLLVMGTSFLFLNPKFNCDSISLDTQQCQSFVCSLPQNQRHLFYEDQNVTSLATQFGPFHCDKVFQLSALRMTLYIGILFGYIVVFYITDNYGRKFSMVVSWGVTVFGIMILSFAFNIWMAVIGLFFAGLGCQSCIRITMTMIGETVQNSLRQKYSIFLEISFGIGSIIIGLGYLWIENWRTITIAFCLVPSVVLLFFLVFYIEETPKFLMMKGVEKTLKALNRIGKINKKQRILLKQDILYVANNQTVKTKKRTALDLFRYKSIRWNFVFASLFMFCINFLYMGPAVIISQLKMSIFTSQIILGATEAVSYPFCSFFIEKLPRKKSGYLLVGIPLIIFIILSFFDVEVDCETCSEGIVETVLVFSARFCICAYFSVFFLFVTEIYPLPLRGIGFGMSSAFGALASISSQFVLSSISKTKVNPMIIFSIVSVIGCLTLSRLPETLGKKLEQKIEEEKQPNIEEKFLLGEN